MFRVVLLVLVLTVIQGFIDPFTKNGEPDLVAIVRHLNNLTLEVAALKAKQDTVTFTARVHKDPYIIPSDGFTFIFDDVVTNVGNGYHPHTGIFHTPVAGTYLFTLQLMASTGVEMEAGIYREGALQALLYLEDKSTEDMTTVTGVFHLNKSDEVSVKRYYGRGSGALRGGYWTQLSGTLLRAD